MLVESAGPWAVVWQVLLRWPVIGRDFSGSWTEVTDTFWVRKADGPLISQDTHSSHADLITENFCQPRFIHCMDRLNFFLRLKIILLATQCSKRNEGLGKRCARSLQRQWQVWKVCQIPSMHRKASVTTQFRQAPTERTKGHVYMDKLNVPRKHKPTTNPFHTLTHLTKNNLFRGQLLALLGCSWSHEPNLRCFPAFSISSGPVTASPWVNVCIWVNMWLTVASPVMPASRVLLSIEIVLLSFPYLLNPCFQSGNTSSLSSPCATSALRNLDFRNLDFQALWTRTDSPHLNNPS